MSGTMRKVEAGRSIIRLSYVLAAVVAVAIVALAALYERQSRLVHRQEERADAQAALSLLRSQVQGVLDGRIQLAQGLVGIIEYQPELTPAEFEALAARLLRGRDGIRALAAAPNLVISMVYPPEAGVLLGRDQLSTPRARGASLMARALGATVLSGPIDLVGGGRGFVARMPVFIDDGADGRQVLGPRLDRPRSGNALSRGRAPRAGDGSRRRGARPGQRGLRAGAGLRGSEHRRPRAGDGGNRPADRALVACSAFPQGAGQRRTSGRNGCCSRSAGS